MSGKSITSYDVAQAAGVSQSAVSRAFSPNASIAKEKRQHIFRIAKEMGYQPNAIARSMSTARSEGRQKSGIVGVVVTRIHDPMFANVLSRFGALLQEKGWHMLVFNVDSSDDVDDALHSLMQFRIDGVIILSAILSDHMAQSCRAKGTPVLLFNRSAHAPEINSVQIDNKLGGRLAAEALLAAGHKRIAFVGAGGNDETSSDREAGFLEALQEAGQGLVAREQGDYTFNSGKGAAHRLFSQAERPDAVFCASDVMALGVLHTARYELGLSVPEDFSLIGFDDIPSAAWPGHQLTSIRQPIEQMIDRAVDVLIGRVEEPDLASEQISIPGELVLRKTVRS